MLKITELRLLAGGAAIILEGRLVGPWVDELRRVTSTFGGREPVTLDLRRLEFADGSGLELLHRLRRNGAVIEGASDFVSALLGGGDDGHSGNE